MKLVVESHSDSVFYIKKGGAPGRVLRVSYYINVNRVSEIPLRLIYLIKQNMEHTKQSCFIHFSFAFIKWCQFNALQISECLNDEYMAQRTNWRNCWTLFLLVPKNVVSVEIFK